MSGHWTIYLDILPYSTFIFNVINCASLLGVAFTCSSRRSTRCRGATATAVLTQPPFLIRTRFLIELHHSLSLISLAMSNPDPRPLPPGWTSQYDAK